MQTSAYEVCLVRMHCAFKAKWINSPSVTVNFGPAHPAAHGVFRLLTTVQGERILSIANIQGLLWRCTENLLEYRNSSLNTGYFARMDYVAFISQEVGFSPDKAKSSSGQLYSSLRRNFVANHLLNVSCTVADSGALGAIL